MRRVIAALSLTVAGVVILLQYQVPPLPPVKRAIVTPVATARVLAAAPPRPKVTPKPPPSPTATATPAPVRALAAAPVTRAHTAAPPRPQRSPSPSPAPTRVYTGAPFPACNYGDVVVQISVTGNRITDAQAPQYPTDRQQSRDINQGPNGNDGAIAQLDAETVRSQSANVDTVSGATCTSDGYKNSLQAAIDQWKA